MVLLSENLKNEDIICVSTSDWKQPYGSKQQIMSILMADNRILYIEAQVSLLYLLLNPRESVKWLMRSMKGLTKRASLYIYTPIPLLPFGNYFLSINWVNQAVLLFFLRRLASKLNFRQPILWIYSINSAEFLGKFNEKLSVYYCLDDFPSEIENKKRKKVMHFLEKRLLINSGIVFACTSSLFEDRKGMRPDIHFVRNGVNFENFSAKINHAETPMDIKNIHSPRIGLIGTFDSRIDVELVLFIAQQRPQWHIVLIGSNTRKGFDIHVLKKYTNIHNLGFKENQLLVQYISMMNVCIIPYHTNGFNRHLFPLKTLEYLAAGMPTVSTSLPELEFLKDVISIAQDKKEFIQCIECLLLNKNNGRRKKLNIAESNSWETKVEEISRHILQKIERNNAETNYQKHLF